MSSVYENAASLINFPTRRDVGRPCNSKRMDFAEWLEMGKERGWVSDRFCWSHDLPSRTAEEQLAIDDGQDPCMPCLRLWD